MRPGFRHPARVKRAARSGRVSDCSVSYGGVRSAMILAPIVLFTDISRGTLTPLRVRRRTARCATRDWTTYTRCISKGKKRGETMNALSTLKEQYIRKETDSLG